MHWNTFDDHNHYPTLLASGQNISAQVNDCIQITDGTYGLDLFKTDDYISTIMKMITKLINFKDDVSDNTLIAAHNWLQKSTVFTHDVTRLYVMDALSKALLLRYTQQLMRQNWLDLPNAMRSMNKIDIIQRFKTQIMKAFQSHHNIINNTASSSSTCLLNYNKVVQCNHVLSVPWMEWSPCVCLVYVPSQKLLEIDITLRPTYIPAHIADLYNIHMDCNVPRDEEMTQDEYDSLDHKSISQCMALLLLGDEDQMSAAIQTCKMKISLMVKAWPRNVFDRSESPEWHHIDIDDPSDIIELKLTCPKVNSIIDPIEAIITTCKDYFSIYTKLTSITQKYSKAGVSSNGFTQLHQQHHHDQRYMMLSSHGQVVL